MVVKYRMDKFLFKRGNKAKLPQLQTGEPFLSKDEERLYIGGNNGNIPLPNKQDMDEVTTQLTHLENQKANKSEITRIDEQLSDVTDSIEEINTVKIDRIDKREPFGTFENAVAQSVIANGDPKTRPQVLGITLDNDSALATYDNRDCVASYRAAYTRGATVDVDDVSYTVDSVTVPIDTDLSKIKPGMIIDTKHSKKYSAFVTEINGNVIKVKNWYQINNISSGQIPPNTAGILINPITKLWVDNVNLFLEEGDPYTAGSIVEYGFFNNQADGGDRTGVDLVSLGSKRPYTGFLTRSSSESNRFIVGFKDNNSQTAFQSGNPNGSDELLSNTMTGFQVLNSGRINRFRGRFATSTQTNAGIDPNQYFVYLINNNVDHQLASPRDCGEGFIFIYNTTDSDVPIGGFFADPSMPGAYVVPAKSMRILFSDASYWYHN